jgi:hypothetical protein
LCLKIQKPKCTKLGFCLLFAVCRGAKFVFPFKVRAQMKGTGGSVLGRTSGTKKREMGKRRSKLNYKKLHNL